MSVYYVRPRRQINVHWRLGMHLFVHIGVRLCSSTLMHVCVCPRLCMFIFVHFYACFCSSMFMHVYARPRLCMFMFVHVYACLCLSTFMEVYVRPRLCMYMFVHLLKCSWSFTLVQVCAYLLWLVNDSFNGIDNFVHFCKRIIHRSRNTGNQKACVQCRLNACDHLGTAQGPQAHGAATNPQKPLYIWATVHYFPRPLSRRALPVENFR